MDHEDEEQSSKKVAEVSLSLKGENFLSIWQNFLCTEEPRIYILLNESSHTDLFRPRRDGRNHPIPSQKIKINDETKNDSTRRKKKSRAPVDPLVFFHVVKNEEIEWRTPPSNHKKSTGNGLNLRRIGSSSDPHTRNLKQKKIQRSPPIFPTQEAPRREREGGRPRSWCRRPAGKMGIGTVRRSPCMARRRPPPPPRVGGCGVARSTGDALGPRGGYTCSVPNPSSRHPLSA